MNDFATYQLNEIIEIIGGGTPKRDNPSFWGGDIPWLSVVDFNNDKRYVASTVERITQQGLVGSSTKLLNTGDIIISARGTVGCLAQLSMPMAFNQSCYGLRGKNNVIINDYLYYLLKIKVRELKQKTHGAVFDTITKETFSHINVNIPISVNVQKKIAKVLSTLDDKIHLNNQINQTLESIAQAIFKSWFIDFDPVRAKIAAKQEGKDPELAAMCAISGKTQAELEQMAADDFAELQATAALFPDELVESELGEVPRGWEVGCIGDEVNTVSKTYPLKQVEEVIFLNTGDILEGKFLHANKSRTESLPGQAKKSIQKDDILYSEIRPQNKRFAYVYFDAEDYVVSTKLMVLRKKSTIPSHFVYFILSRQSTIDFLQVMAESRSGTFPQITFDVLSKVEYLKPNNNALIDIFTRKVLSPFFDKKVMNETENNKLIGVRDNLLPKLLSGELDVSGLQGEGA